MAKAIKATISLNVFTTVSDDTDILLLGDIVPAIKESSLHLMKRELFKKAETLTLHDIRFETMHVPDLGEFEVTAVDDGKSN